MLAFGDTEPPAYLTEVSAVPRNVMTVIGRGGLHMSTVSWTRSAAAGATAANRSAASHPRYWVIPPPSEKPTAYTCFGSMHATFSTSATSARAKPTSSASTQHVPRFHEVPSEPERPAGNAMTAP